MNEITPVTRYILALSQLSGVGPATLKKIIKSPGFGYQSIELIAEENTAIARAIKSPLAWEIAQEFAENQITEAVRNNARIISAFDADYPKLLSLTKDDPLILFVKGSFSPSPEQSVAIIGTREPTTHGQRIAKLITQFFVEEEWSVVSGLAIGCDSVAHEATLDAGGHTVAVLAHGLQMIAPSRNRKLAERILNSGGALVTEYPFGQVVQKQQYVKRDRTQAGLAQGVVMIQSDIVGGSLHASRAALDYRRWLAVPFPTERDRQKNEPKIQANLVITAGNKLEKATLLRCPESVLNSVLVLKSRDDYLLMKEGLEKISLHASNVESERVYLPEEFTQDENLIDPVLLGGNEISKIVIDEDADYDITAAEKCKNRLVEKSILQLPFLENGESIGWFHLLSESIEIADAISSRLKCLQIKLENIRLALENIKDSAQKEQRHVLCFALDDFVGQMSYSVEFVVAVNLLLRNDLSFQGVGENDKSLSTLGDFSRENGRQESILIDSMCSGIDKELNKLRESSTIRLISASDTTASDEWIDDVVDVLALLCDDFNQFVQTAILDQHSSYDAINEPRSGTSENAI